MARARRISGRQQRAARAHRLRRAAEQDDVVAVGTRTDGDWVVRSITGASSTKPYRCPGCDQLIRPATPHVVVWPAVPSLQAVDGLSERRHWHTGCWQVYRRQGR